MQEQKKTVQKVFDGYSSTEVVTLEDGSDYQIEIVSPEGFLEALQTLGLSDLTEVEVQCLMLILIKPELENNILLSDV